jgi:hypothetical protein
VGSSTNAQNIHTESTKTGMYFAEYLEMPFRITLKELTEKYKEQFFIVDRLEKHISNTGTERDVQELSELCLLPKVE